MALVPVAEILLRALLRVGISGAASFTQHFALIAGMLGAAVAAREQRLLSLSTLDSLLVGRGALLARFFTRTVAVIVGALLCLASVELVLAERAGGNVIAYGIPVWLGQAALPLGFALITLRLAWSASVYWPARLATLALAAAVAAAAASRLPLGNVMATTAVCVVLVAAILGSPVFTTLGGVALFLFWSDGLPMASIPLDHYRLVVNPSLPMIPLDRKSTRLNSSHRTISYAVFCLKKKHTPTPSFQPTSSARTHCSYRRRPRSPTSTTRSNASSTSNTLCLAATPLRSCAPPSAQRA